MKEQTTKTRKAKRNGGASRSSVQRLVSRAYAWKIQDMTGRWHLCHWASPSRDVLEMGGKPSPEAQAVRVVMTTG